MRAPKMTAPISGQCTCGQLEFHASAPPVAQIICHCADCRDATGDDYSITAFFKTDAMRITGKVNNCEYTTDAGTITTRQSCTDFGVFLFDRSAGFPHLIGVFTRQINPPFAAVPTCHMWTKTKQSDVTIHPELEEYPQGIS